jgi:hypothetical protein
MEAGVSPGTWEGGFSDRVDRERNTLYDDANKMKRSNPASRLVAPWLIGALCPFQRTTTGNAA